MAGATAHDAVWSMIPHGTPTNPFSARWASSGAVRPGQVEPAEVGQGGQDRALQAAEEDRPAPAGTSRSTARSAPRTSCPASRSAHTTPAT